MKNPTRAVAVGTLLIGCASALAQPPPVSYYSMNGATITELGDLGGTESWANDINNSGVIVGAAFDANETRRAFRFDGNMIDISLGAFTMSSAANGINSSGEIVGTFEVPGIPQLGNPPPPPQSRGFYWESGAPLVPLAAPTSDSDWQAGAAAINDSGVIAGFAFEGPYVDYDGPCFGLIPMRWSSFTSIPAPILCAYGYATSINNAGSIVGTTASGLPTMFRVVNGASTPLPQQPAIRGLTKQSFGQAEGISGQNRIVGQHYYQQQISPSHSMTRTRAFYWNGSSAYTTLLGVLPGGRASKAMDINAQLMVIGHSETNPDDIAYYEKAYIWHPDFGMKTLPSLPTAPPLLTPGNCFATALNDRQASQDLVQATGYCMVSGKRRAVRWNISIDHVVFDF